MKTLPTSLILRLSQKTVDNQVPGSTSNCYIGLELTDKATKLGAVPSFVRVRYNGVTVTWKKMIHHYALPNLAGRVQLMNEAGDHSHMVGKTVTLKMVGVPVPAQDPATVSQSRVNANRRARIAAGKPDKVYQNPRKMVARAMKMMKA